MNILLQLLVSVISIVLALVVMGSMSGLKKNPDKAVVDKANNAYNAATGLLVFSLGGLVMALLGWKKDAGTKGGYKKSLYDYLS